ncbi:sulfatase [Carboxylicivirga sp. A043]|uniref:sulfatase family protein n=1 Tax=Carboxylicivirga litoralis TaxID=2816963 RepID=UPI0021CB777F|nr:sulfatase [Carboxylicivirga sp. A043]MCU4157764.1 sulfatase [Carboxylicivirga sp. A043]
MMNKMLFCNRICLVLGMLMMMLLSCTKEKEPTQPNILWLTFEDTSPQFIGCYGNEEAHTPVMDQLATEGIRFTSAFSTGTVCSPSRFALITGCRTTRFSTGHHRSYYPVGDSIEAFPKYLRDAGYYTSNNSKTDYNTSKRHHFIKTGWNESSNKAGWWKRQPGQPFFAVFNSFHSHQSRTMTNPWWKYKEQILDSLNNDDIISGNEIEVPPIFNDTKEMRNDLSRIYNAIQLTDQHFGRILKRLESEGLKDSTIIFCFSDHGQGMPWGKTYPRAMGYRVPFIIYFPKMYQHLSPWGTQVVTDAMIDFVDLPATVLSLAGIEPPQYMDGNALLGQFKEGSKKYTIGSLDRSGENTTLCRSISDGRYIYNRNFMPFQSEKRWQKYFDFSDISQHIREDFKNDRLNEVQAGLLKLNGNTTFYHLEEDPWEIYNLKNEPSLASMIKDFEVALKSDLIKNRDAHFIPEYSLKLSQRIPYELSRDNNFFPAEEVIEQAFKCGDQKALDSHLKGLKHENDIVRYWSAVGVYSHFRLFGYDKRMDVISTDAYAPADVFIQALKYQGNSYNEDAQSKLLKYIASENETLAPLASQLLLLTPEIDEQFLERILQTCAKSGLPVTKECGELFENNFKGKHLEYKMFW